MPTVVSVQDLRKRYRSRDPWAVDGISFQLEAGEAFGLLGPNGAGKTSIVKMISGLLRPDAGKISLFGSDPGNPAARVDLGFAPEDPDFPKYLRAREVNVERMPQIVRPFRTASTAYVASAVGNSRTSLPLAHRIRVHFRQ